MSTGTQLRRAGGGVQIRGRTPPPNLPVRVLPRWTQIRGRATKAGAGHQAGRLRSAAGSSKTKRGESVVACSGVQVTTDPLICGVGDHARGFMAPDTVLTLGHLIHHSNS